MKAGEIIAGHTLERLMGGGSGGEVWLARFGGQAVALKLFKTQQISVRIQAENIAQYVLSRGDDPRARYFARAEHFDLEAQPAYLRMELVAGRTLREALDDGLDEPAMRRIGEALFSALDYAHDAGFVHGDLKPENILLPEGEGQPAIKLIDVGFGQLVTDETADALMHSMGSLDNSGLSTPLYAPPERFSPAYRDDPQVARATDLYMAGKLLFEGLTGQSPQTILPVSRARPGLDPGWDELVFALVEADPHKRPTAKQALDQLPAQTATVVSPTPPTSPPSPTSPPVDDFPTPSPLMALAYLGLPLLALLVVFALSKTATQAAALPSAGSESAESWAEHAQSMVSRGRPDLALLYHRQALGRDPQHAPSLLWLALQSASPKDLDQALLRYRALVKSAPRDPAGHYGLALIYRKKQELRQARTFAGNAVELAPNNPQTHNLLGEISMSYKKYGFALRCFSTAARLDPSQPILHYNQGLAHRQLDQYTEATRCFERAFEIAPRSAAVLYKLASLAYADPHREDGTLRRYLGKLHLAAPKQAARLLREIDHDNPHLANDLRQFLRHK